MLTMIHNQNSVFRVLLLSVILLIILFNQLTFSQIDSTTLNTEEIIYDLLQEPATESDNEDIYEILEDITLNPVELNSADISELQRIPGLSAYYASLIIEHREKFGAFFSLSELNLIEGFPKEIVEKVKPFMTIVQEKFVDDTDRAESTKSGWDDISENLKLNFRSRTISDIQEKRGFTENKFEGSRPKIYNRLLIKYGGLIDAGISHRKRCGRKIL